MFSMGSALVIEFFSCSLHCLYMETVGCVEKWDGDAGTGDMGTRGLRDSGTWRRGDAGMRGHGDSGTHFYHLFNFSSYFTKSWSVDRNCVVTRFKFLVSTM